MIAGPTVYICNECVDLCNEILAEATVTSTDQLDALLPQNLDCEVLSSR